MRKILLGFILFSLIVTVSYVKTVRSERSKESIRAEIINESAVEQELLTSVVDSLQSELRSSKNTYTDSLSTLNEFIDNRSDSLEFLLNLSEEQIEALKSSYEKKIKSIEKKLRNSSKKTSTSKISTTKKKKISQSLETEKKILKYYRERYEELPHDLTEYERRVVIAEIREETLNKFKITMSYLNNLRDKNKLEF